MFLNHFPATVGSAKRADLVGRFNIVALSTGNQGGKTRFKVAAPFPLSRLGVFSFWQRHDLANPFLYLLAVCLKATSGAAPRANRS